MTTAGKEKKGRLRRRRRRKTRRRRRGWAPIWLLPETEMARTPLRTASSFFSLLDTLGGGSDKDTVKQMWRR